VRKCPIERRPARPTLSPPGPQDDCGSFWRRQGWLLRAVGFGPLVLALAGCGGRATVQIVSLQTKDIDERRPLIWRCETDRCYWWLEPDGTVNVAIQYENVSLVGELGKVRLALSLSLEALPAGEVRTYPVRGRALRAGAQFGPDHRRFRSYQGVVLVRRVGPSRIRGRFRIFALQQQFSVVTGWRFAGMLLFLGRFEAVADERKARPIVQASEVDDWARPPREPKPATSRPASRPATAPTRSSAPAAQTSLLGMPGPGLRTGSGRDADVAVRS